MKRLLRWVFTSILFVATVVIAGGLALLYGASREQVLSTGINDFEQATGFQVELDETFEPVLWPIPGWRLGAVSIVGDGGGPAQLRLTAKESLLTLGLTTEQIVCIRVSEARDGTVLATVELSDVATRDAVSMGSGPRAVAISLPLVVSSGLKASRNQRLRNAGKRSNKPAKAPAPRAPSALASRLSLRRPVV